MTDTIIYANYSRSFKHSVHWFQELLALLQSPKLRFASLLSDGLLADAEADSSNDEDSTQVTERWMSPA